MASWGGAGGRQEVLWEVEGERRAVPRTTHLGHCTQLHAMYPLKQSPPSPLATHLQDPLKQHPPLPLAHTLAAPTPPPH